MEKLLYPTMLKDKKEIHKLEEVTNEDKEVSEDHENVNKTTTEELIVIHAPKQMYSTL